MVLPFNSLPIHISYIVVDALTTDQFVHAHYIWVGLRPYNLTRSDRLGPSRQASLISTTKCGLPMPSKGQLLSKLNTFNLNVWDKLIYFASIV